VRSTLLARKAMQWLAQPPVALSTDGPLQSQGAAEAPPSTPAPVVPRLPEAPASVNVRLMIDGRGVQLTLRDTDESRLLQRVETLLQHYPTLPTKAPQHGRMKQGKKGWFCPRTLDDESWLDLFT
jgi:hypothetical protein